MTSAPPVPTFLGIGPGKAGTTWLYRLLRAHPEVWMSPVKETLYFTREHGRGRDWYLGFFEGAGAYPASGEISNTYVFSAEAPARVRDYRSDMQLITTLRHPVDRAFSHYLWLVRNGELGEGFEAALEARPDLLERGRYGDHLARWLEHFPREQLLVLPFWELVEYERAFARRVFAFLGVDRDFWPEGAEERALGAARPRSRWAARAAKLGARALRRLGLPRVVQALKESPVVELLWEPWGEDRPQLDAALRSRLVRRLADDVERLGELTGVDFAGRWLEKDGGGAGTRHTAPDGALPPSRGRGASPEEREAARDG